LPVGLDPLRCRKAFFYEADRASVGHGTQSRDEPRLWPSFSSTPTVHRAWRLVARRLGSSTAQAPSRLTSPDSRLRAQAVRVPDPHAKASSFWQLCNGPRQKYQRLRQVSLGQIHKQAPVLLVSQLNTPSFLMNGANRSINASAKRYNNF
jgi:hypothetical protein